MRKPQKDLILIVEDSPPNRKILEHLVKKLGFDVIGLANGREAWEYLESEKGQAVKAILSDLMMPEVDGLQLLSKIRNESHAHKNLPVVLITAVQDKDCMVAAQSLNVSGYLLKPITFDKVKSQIHNIFSSYPSTSKVG